jgi:hypothetical protein
MGGLAGTVANVISHDQLGVCVQGRPGPHIARAIGCGLCARYVLFLGVAKRPDFIALDARGFDVADGFVVQGQARLASVNQQLGHRIDRHIAHARDRPHGRPFAKKGEDLGAFGRGQLVHAHIDMNLFAYRQAENGFSDLRIYCRVSLPVESLRRLTMDTVAVYLAGTS